MTYVLFMDFFQTLWELLGTFWEILLFDYVVVGSLRNRQRIRNQREKLSGMVFEKVDFAYDVTTFIANAQNL